MENGMTMGDCLRTNKLIILRGNSGSGKTTIAKELQQVFGNNTMLISQDVIRRDMLKVKDGENTKALPLLEELLRYGRKHSEIVILEGEEVRSGKVIGFIGSSGKSTGNHLHYEVRKYGRPVRPYIRKRRGL